MFTNNISNSTRRVAIFFIAVVMILSLLATALFVARCPDKSSTANATATLTSTSPTTTTPKSIGIRDMSVSMSKYVTAVPGYDTWTSFGDDGTSRITTEVVNALEQGYERIGVVTDLESYPKTEMNSITGKHYQNVELTFFVPASVNQNYLNSYINTFKGALDVSNCTLKFIDMNGQEISVLYNNYAVQASTSPVTVHATYTEGNSIPRSVVIIGLEALFLVIMALIIALIALCNRCCCGFIGGTGTSSTPEGVSKALNADAIALDGSSSVVNAYHQFIRWAKNNGWRRVYRFASEVEEMSISKAEAQEAQGGTAGYAAMKEMYDAGHKVVTIVSDMEFTDEENHADGVFFDKIYFVGENLSDAQVEPLKRFCKDYEIVRI